MRHCRSGQRGFSVSELLVTMVIMGVIVSGTLQAVLQLQRSNRYFEANALLKTMGQAAVNRMGAKVMVSKKFFDDSADGRAYLALLDLGTAARQPIASSKLPVAQSNASFSPSQLGDPSAPFLPGNVGNSLMLATVETPFLCQGAGFSRLLNTYRMHYYYLSRASLAGAQRHLGNSYVYDLAGWHGAALVDYHQLAALLAEYPAERGAILAALSAARLDTAWDYAAPAASALYGYDFASGALRLAANARVRRDLEDSVTRLSGPQGDLTFGIAANASSPETMPVPAFAVADAGGDGFPHGFEVMIGGASGGRRVYLRLVQSAAGYNQQVFQESTGVFQGRDI